MPKAIYVDVILCIPVSGAESMAGSKETNVLYYRGTVVSNAMWLAQCTGTTICVHDAETLSVVKSVNIAITTMADFGRVSVG